MMLVRRRGIRYDAFEMQRKQVRFNDARDEEQAGDVCDQIRCMNLRYRTISR